MICAELLHHIVTLETIVHLASLQLRESGCWKGESLHLVRVRGSGCVKAKKVLVILLNLEWFAIGNLLCRNY